jgi:hypothetical protein
MHNQCLCTYLNHHTQLANWAGRRLNEHQPLLFLIQSQQSISLYSCLYHADLEQVYWLLFQLAITTATIKATTTAAHATRNGTRRNATERNGKNPLQFLRKEADYVAFVGCYIANRWQGNHPRVGRLALSRILEISSSLNSYPFFRWLQLKPFLPARQSRPKPMEVKLSRRSHSAQNQRRHKIESICFVNSHY